MYIKPDIIRFETDLALADTYKFDELPETGLSAGLLLTIDAPVQSGQHYDVSSEGEKVRLIDYIDEIKLVVNGKRPILDLNGELCEALEFWNTGRTSVSRLADRTLHGDHVVIPLTLGRFLGDTEYCLDWSKYSSIELQVKNSLTTTLHGSATISIKNLKIADAAGLVSKGIFQNRIWREWTTVQNKRWYFKPPKGNKYRRIILQSNPPVTTSAPYHRKREFDYVLNEIKLTFLDGDEVFFDGYGDELMERNAWEFPHEAHTYGVGLASPTGTTSIRTGIGKYRSMVVSKAEVGAAATDNYPYGVYTYTDDIVAVYCESGMGNAYVYWACFGLGYQNTLNLMFDQFGPEHYMDSEEKAPLNLEVLDENNADAVGATNKIVLCELVDH